MAKKTAKRTPSSRVLLKDMPLNSSLKFKAEEAYKSIRANIMLSVMKKGTKKIVVSSSAPGEGKTTTTINLAISIAEADQKVLLIDGDLRKPKIHHYFSTPNSPGLTNYLGSMVNNSQKMDLASVVQATEIPNLSILASGSIPPNPSEILGSEPMSDFLDSLEGKYDYVVIDTPPLNVVSDALPLIKETDGVVLIVRSNASTYPELDKALSSLEFINAKILGFVVNFEESERRRYYYAGRYYGKYYGRYYKYKYGYNYNYGYGYYSGYEYGAKPNKK